MKKETQREKIERLTKFLDNAMKDKAKSFNNSSDYVQMKKYIEDLEQACNELIKINKILNEQLEKYSRSGRHKKFSKAEEETIKMYRMQGKTIQEIAHTFDCSVGLVHKIVKSLQ